VNGRKKVVVDLDGGQEPDGVQEVEVEVDAGPEVNSVQELVDGGQGLDRGQGLEVNGRQEVEVELDGVQDVDGGQEVNRRQRRVGNEYAMGGIRLQTSSVLLTKGAYAMYVIEY
jgi:hypothetical protein